MMGCRGWRCRGDGGADDGGASAGNGVSGPRYASGDGRAGSAWDVRGAGAMRVPVMGVPVMEEPSVPVMGLCWRW